MRRPRLTRIVEPQKKKWEMEIRGENFLTSMYSNLDKCWRRKSCDILRVANMIFANLLLLKAGVAFVTGVTNEFCGLFHCIKKILGIYKQATLQSEILQKMIIPSTFNNFPSHCEN